MHGGQIIHVRGINNSRRGEIIHGGAVNSRINNSRRGINNSRGGIKYSRNYKQFTEAHSRRGMNNSRMHQIIHGGA